MKESETAKDGREREERWCCFPPNRAAKGKRRESTLSPSHSLSSLCLVLLYVLSLALSLAFSVEHHQLRPLSRSLFVYARCVAHWKIYAVNYRPGNTTFESGIADTKGIFCEPLLLCLSVWRTPADPPEFFCSSDAWKTSILCRGDIPSFARPRKSIMDGSRLFFLSRFPRFLCRCRGISIRNPKANKTHLLNHPLRGQRSKRVFRNRRMFQ